jgi:hypothetical protein
MNETLKSILESRYDLSDYLFHFTKGENAKETLTRILTDKKIKDINIRGAICFTEAPLPSLVKMFDVFAKYSSPMYAPYGIAVLKKDLFDLGARPVIYGPADEKILLDKSIHWRYESYIPHDHDFSWLREWRIKTDVKLDNSKSFVITNTKQEELDHSFEEGDIDVDGCIADGQFWPEYKREWKSISIETLREVSIFSNDKLKEDINKQSLGDELNIYLGSG